MQNTNKQRTFARTRATPAARPTQAQAGLLRPGLGWSPGLCAASRAALPSPATNPVHSDRQGLPPGPGLLKWGEGSAAAAPTSGEPLRSPGPF